MHTDPATTDPLRAQVQAARTRMMFSHIPLGTSIAVGLGVMITLLVRYECHGDMGPGPWVWLAGLVFFSGLHIYRSFLFFRAKDRRDPRWLRRIKLSILTFSTWWGGLLWAFPVEGRLDLQAALVGSLIGLAACGAFMLTVDRGSARCWLVPMLGSVAAYCAWQFNVLGLFGFFTVSGFIGILWLETGRAHRRTRELLYLRFNNDRINASQAAALREAEALSQAKGQFLATMSHEMRTPLHGILGLSRLIRPELRTQQGHEQLNLLEASGQHLLGVINDVLDYSRLQTGRIALSRAPVNLSALAREVCDLAAVNGLDKGLEVVFDTSLPDHYGVEADAGRLKQVLHNLMGNAVKFTERGQVALHLHDLKDGAGQPQGLCFEVVDTGIGIPAHELPHIFEAFHQVDGSYERKSAGSGLGLSIARELCLAMGGTLSCTSVPGQGSRFRCVLPLPRVSLAPVAAPGPRPEPTRVDPTRPQAALVLLVEDNPVNALVARAELEQMGLQVAHAENGRQALEWLANHDADLVLMDCHMPDMNGFEATRRIRDIEVQRGAARTPIVALTASAQQEVQADCLQAGMDDCLSKPFHRADLLRVVRRHASGWRRRQGASRAGVGVLAPAV